MLLDNGAFMDAVVCLATGDGWRCAGVDAKFKAKHGSRSAFGIEGIPVGLDDISKLGAESGVKVGWYVKVGGEVCEMLTSVPGDQVRARRNVIIGAGASKGMAVFGCNKQIVIYIVIT